MKPQPDLLAWADMKELRRVSVLARSGSSGLARKAQKRLGEIRLEQLKREMMQ